MIHAEQPRSKQAVRVSGRASPRFASPPRPPRSRYSYSSRRIQTRLLWDCLKPTDQKNHPSTDTQHSHPPAAPLLGGTEGLPRTPRSRSATAWAGFALPRCRCCPSHRTGVSEAPLLACRDAKAALPRSSHGCCSGRGFAPWVSGSSARRFQGIPRCPQGRTRAEGLAKPGRGLAALQGPSCPRHQLLQHQPGKHHACQRAESTGTGGRALAPQPPTLPTATMGTAFPHMHRHRHCELPPPKEKKNKKEIKTAHHPQPGSHR